MSVAPTPAARPTARARTVMRRLLPATLGAALAAAAGIAAVPSAGASSGPVVGTHQDAVSAVVDGLHLTRVCGLPVTGHAACNAITNDSANVTVHPHAAPSGSGYGPAQIQGAYGLTPAAGVGTGPTVAVVDAYDDPTAASDLATYRSSWGLSNCTDGTVGCILTKVGEGAALPASDSGWALEESLDLDAVTAACPACRILLVEANSATTADLGASVNKAAAYLDPAGKHVVAISNSYGGAESSSDPTTTATYYTHPGIAITVSAGDSGYGVEYPAAAPTVTSVGGTHLVVNSNNTWNSETVWGAAPSFVQKLLGQNPAGTGSGCSAYENRPAGQPTISGCAKRIVSDVSAVADPATGLAVYDTTGQSGWVEVGGTSLSSPLIAAIYAQGGSTTAINGPNLIYAAPAGSFHDVTSGTNGSCSNSKLCTAGSGYDGPTGVGTPKSAAVF
ncbi:MAG TPA: S53 family peptidase [Mycobacteriales bacterium]|nr:S53 family peptidase [Mycobacteriales bacterium]